jgi:hypothetical protein
MEINLATAKTATTQRPLHRCNQYLGGSSLL